MSSVDPSNNVGAQSQAAFQAMMKLQIDINNGAPSAEIEKDVKNLKATMSTLANNPDVPEQLKIMQIEYCKISKAYLEAM